MLKLKENVSGFIYDSCHGKVTQIFSNPVNVFTLQVAEDEVFVDNDFVNELFEITNHQHLQNCGEGLDLVLDFYEE